MPTAHSQQGGERSRSPSRRTPARRTRRTLWLHLLLLGGAAAAQVGAPAPCPLLADNAFRLKGVRKGVNQWTADVHLKEWAAGEVLRVQWPESTRVIEANHAEIIHTKKDGVTIRLDDVSHARPTPHTPPLEPLSPRGPHRARACADSARSRTDRPRRRRGRPRARRPSRDASHGGHAAPRGRPPRDEAVGDVRGGACVEDARRRIRRRRHAASTRPRSLLPARTRAESVLCVLCVSSALALHCPLHAHHRSPNLAPT